MEEKEILHKEVQPVFKHKPLLLTIKNSLSLKASKHFIYLLVFSGMLFSNACIIGKSTREPTFIPEDNNVRKQHKRRVFVAGHWSRGAKGKHWIRGHWERK